MQMRLLNSHAIEMENFPRNEEKNELKKASEQNSKALEFLMVFFRLSLSFECFVDWLRLRFVESQFSNNAHCALRAHR